MPRLLALLMLTSGACARDKAADTGVPDTAATWTTLPARCEAPGALLADPLALEGEDRVTQTAGSGFMEAVDVEVDGVLAYAVGMGRLMIFDVSDPSAPTRLYGPAETGGGKLHRVEPLGEGWLATSQRDDGVQIWDVSDPAAATEVGEIALSGMEGLAWVGDRLWVTVRDEGVRAYDVSDPTAPALLASAPGLSAPWELTSSGDGWLYAADNTLGVVPIDIRDPDAPVVGTPVPLDGVALHVRYADGRIYAAAGGAGVSVLDATDRAAPKVTTRVTTGGSAVMSDVADGRLWVADHEGLAVYDLSGDDPTPLQVEQTEQFALAIDAEGSRAFVGDWNLFEVWALDDALDAPALDAPSDEIRLEGGAGQLVITNRGSGALTLSGATAEGATIEVERDVLSPGDSATLRLTGAVAGAALCLASDDPDEPVRSFTLTESGEPPVGEAAPDFALQGLDRTTYRLSEQLGHPVLLVYFATW